MYMCRYKKKLILISKFFFIELSKNTTCASVSFFKCWQFLLRISILSFLSSRQIEGHDLECKRFFIVVLHLINIWTFEKRVEPIKDL